MKTCCFGGGVGGGERTGDFLRSDEVDRIGRLVASQELNVKHGHPTLELAMSALILAVLWRGRKITVCSFNCDS